MLVKRMIVGLVVALLSVNVAGALSLVPVGTPNSGSGSLLFGQEHFYSVVFRGNGEAIVYGKFVVTNTTDEPMNTYSFQIPGVMPYEMVVYQQKISSPCLRYGANSICLQYDTPNYSEYYPDRYNRRRYTEYKKAEFNANGNQYTVTLPYSVAPGETTAVIAAYAAKGYVTKSLGLYRFRFETIRVESRISAVTVTADVDSDLYLRGKKAEVDYDVPMADMFVMPSVKQGVSSEVFDTMVSNIGGYGAWQKNAKNLAPTETFIVEGAYSKSWFRLNLGSFVTAFLVIATIIVGAYWGRKFVAKKFKSFSRPATQATIQNQPAGQEKTQNKLGFNPFNLKPLIAGLISVVCVALLTYGIGLLSRIGWLSGGSEPVIQVFIVIAIGIAYVAAVSAPAAIIQARHGAAAMWSVFAAQFLWLVLFIVLYLTLFSQIYDHRWTT